MVCDRCQERSATIHVKEVIQGEVKEQHLCSQCAQASGHLFDFGETASNIWTNFFAGQLPRVSQGEASCTRCGLNQREFQRRARAGCPQCYTQLGSVMEPLLRRIHGTVIHQGKVPKGLGGMMSKERQKQQLKKALAEAIGSEDYEKAAQIRDEIRLLEGGE